MASVPDAGNAVNSLAAAKNLLPSVVQERKAAEGRMVPFIGWTSIQDLLDVAFGADGWSATASVDWPPVNSPFPPLMAVTISAGNVDRTAHARVISVRKADGTLLQPVHDVESLKDGTRWTTGADPYEVAERAAFVRAAAMFGLRVPTDRLPAQEPAQARPAAQPAAQNRPAQAPPQRDGEQQTQAPPRGEQPSGALEGEPTEFRINGVLWKRTKSGDGYLADVDAAQYGGATRLLLKRGKDGKGYGACCFDENGPMKQVGWHNGDTAKAAIAGLEAALGFVPF